MQSFKDNSLTSSCYDLLEESLRLGLDLKREREQSNKVGIIRSSDIHVGIDKSLCFKDELEKALPLTKGKVHELFNKKASTYKNLVYHSLMELYRGLLKLYTSGLVSDELLKYSKECCSKLLVSKLTIDEICNLIDGK